MYHPSCDTAKCAPLPGPGSRVTIQMTPFTRIGYLVLAVLAFVTLLGFAACFGQKATPSPTPEEVTGAIRVKTDLVTLTLTVTDPYNRYVSGLNKNAFTI